MRAYVQQVPSSHPLFTEVERSASWFDQRGDEVIRFEYADIAAGKLDEDLLHRPDEMVVRGGVMTVRQLLLRAGRPLPPNMDLPPSLSAWIGRRWWESTLGQIRAGIDSPDFQPIHMKPLYEQKLFKGMVVRRFRDLIPTAGLSGGEPVLVQEYVEFVSEWRASILRDKILNVAHYRGRPVVFPDSERIQSAVPAFADRPIAFGMDWGVTATGQTLLVEVNDGFSLGNYGLRGPAYCAILIARWRQLMGLPDQNVGEFADD